MIDILKNVALTLMVIGFGLSALLPMLLNLMFGVSLSAFMSNKWTDKLIQYGMLLVTVLATIAFGAYFIGLLYYIWIY